MKFTVIEVLVSGVARSQQRRQGTVLWSAGAGGGGGADKGRRS